MKPFLKWAGGKRWIVQRHANIFPSDYRVYYEPFLGSGAVFFHLQPAKAVLSDKNGELINTYIAMRDDWSGVWKKLHNHQRRHNEEYYYRVRASSPRSLSGVAARLIYLNRTCFNALYRVNRKGIFNVPKGTKETVILPDDDFEAMAITLNNCNIVQGDFADVINKAKNNDLLYVDPPYTVKHNNNNFIKYNERIFSWEDQLRLATVVNQAHKRGVKIIMSNADNNCIRELYLGFTEHIRLSRHSILAANSQNRKITSELLITNFPTGTPLCTAPSGCVIM